MMKSFLTLLLCPLLLAASPQTRDLRAMATEQLNSIASTLRYSYAPEKWKGEHFGWELEEELAKAQAAILNTPDLSLSDYHRILRDFLASTRDYHVSVHFTQSGRAELPLSIRSAEGRYFIAALDDDAVASWRFPFGPGDEVVSMDGKPIQQVIDELRKTELPYTNTPETDQRLLESMLTSRLGSRANILPRGTVTLGIRDGYSGEITNAQLIWQRSEEKLREVPIQTRQNPDFPAPPMLDRRVRLPSLERERNPHGVGSLRSWVPELGLKIWETDKDEKYHAYLYKNEDGKLIGYLRIPFFDDEALGRLLEHISYFQRVADALVIDQVNNPGGDPMIMYAIASLFAVEPLDIPTDQYALDQSLIDWARWMVQASESSWFERYCEEVLYPLPVDGQTPHYVTEWCRDLLRAHEAGALVSPPTWFIGCDQIMPCPMLRFTKPVLVLINELDFSCADYFAAVMKDNQIATLFGQRTAGAGGGTLRKRLDLPLDVSSFAYTCLISWRPGGSPIENLGVEPDILYEVTADDYCFEFWDYAEAVNHAVSELLPGSEARSRGCKAWLKHEDED